MPLVPVPLPQRTNNIAQRAMQILTPGNATSAMAAQQVLRGANPQRAIGGQLALNAAQQPQNIGNIAYQSGTQQAAQNAAANGLPVAEVSARQAAAQAAQQAAAQGTVGVLPVEAPAVGAAAASDASRVAAAQALRTPVGTAGANALATPLAEADFAAPVAETATKGGIRAGITGLLSRTPFLGSEAAAAAAGEGTGLLGAGGALAAGSLGRGLGYAGLGLLAGNVAQGLTGEQDGTWDDVLQYGATGAGLGAGAGSMIVPGLGTAIGGGAGAVLGGIYGAIFGDDKSDKTKSRDALRTENQNAVNYMAKMGVPPEDQAKIVAQLQYQGAGLKPADVKTLYQSALPQYTQAALGLVSQSKAEDKRTARTAAIQQYLLPQLSAQVDYTNRAAQAYGDAAGNQAIPYWQAQSNTSYLAQIAALSSMAGQRSAAAVPDLNDYLAQYLTADQQMNFDPAAATQAVIAGKQAQSQINQQAQGAGNTALLGG